MSKEKMQLMNQLRSLNNSKIVDNVILVEDQETYPPAIRILMNRYKDIIMSHNLIPRLRKASTDMNINEELSRYMGTPDEGFVQYICQTKQQDFDFTKQIVTEATKESIREELETARRCVQERKVYKPASELGLEYDLKNGRIREYIMYYTNELQTGRLIGYNERRKQDEEENIFRHIKGNSQNSNYISMEERIALSIAAKYISTLNDNEFIQLLQDTELIDEDKRKSLTRKYKDVDLKQEVYVGKNWQVIKNVQKEAQTQLEGNKTTEQK